MKLLGVDFTSAPRAAKPIVAAWAHRQGHTVVLESLLRLRAWAEFEQLLHTPGPWIGGFDLPLGLPRELVEDLHWPDHWPDLIQHCQTMGKAAFKEALDGYRQRRPAGQKFAHRATDHPAGSSSPMKLVHPPVALMFFEGASRLLSAGLHFPAHHPGDERRVALEAYPGYTARSITRQSYKSDTRQEQTPARAAARASIIEALLSGNNPLEYVLHAPDALIEMLHQDAAGDALDATLCAMQAGWAEQRRQSDWGLPGGVDRIEGWIITVPRPEA